MLFLNAFYLLMDGVYPHGYQQDTINLFPLWIYITHYSPLLPSSHTYDHVSHSLCHHLPRAPLHHFNPLN